MSARKRNQQIFRGMDREEQELYEERLFRDSFLEKTEEKHHAFRSTVLALLLLFLGMMLFLYLYVLPEEGTETAGVAQTEVLGGVRTGTVETWFLPRGWNAGRFLIDK